MLAARDRREPLSVAYHGNVVDLLEWLERQGLDVDLLSDQTSCHEPYDGGYTPAGLTFEQGRELLRGDREAFRQRVDVSLGRHFEVLRRLCGRGMRFWDYGNAFMKAVLDAACRRSRATACDGTDGFIWPSYVEDIMGPMCFDYGYGPFRWVCLSGNPEISAGPTARRWSASTRSGGARTATTGSWIRDAEGHRLVVGTQARILYADAEGRTRIARRFNAMVRDGIIGPVMMGRDHHDVGGTDSPFRETANIDDGSMLTADMAHQCWAGNAARGMTWPCSPTAAGSAPARRSTAGSGSSSTAPSGSTGSSTPLWSGTP